VAWILLLIASVFEIAWAIGIKMTEGFTRPWPSILTIMAMIISMVSLSLAVRTIPIGTGYAIWTGLGAVGTVLLGMMFFGESANPSRLLFLGMILVGVLGLKLTTS